MQQRPIISQEFAIAPNLRWWRFTYNGKPRVALVLGPDKRGSGCLMCLTPDGTRAFKPGKMMGIEDFTTLGDAA